MKKFLIITCSILTCITSNAQLITTVVGNGTIGFAGDGGAANLAKLNYPEGVTFDTAGNMYIADRYNHRIRKVLANTGIITTVAGNGTGSFGGDAGAATSAMLNNPTGVVLDAAGNMYIADFFNRRIRKVTVSTGIITTIAGNGALGYTGDAGPATSATLYGPRGMAIDAAGNLYFADGGNNVIRKVTASTGIITTIAGNGTAAFAGDNGQASSSQLNSPMGIAMDAAENIYIADMNNYRIRKITKSTGIITTVAGNGTSGNTGNGGAATSAALSVPYGVSVDVAGNIYIANNSYNIIRMVLASSGFIYSIVGDGNPGYVDGGGCSALAQLNNPTGTALDNLGNMYIADQNNHRIRKVRKSPFISQPVSVSICAYANASFSFIAAMPLQGLQWQINNGSGFTTLTDSPGNISGATTSTVTITGALAATMNGYSFKCLIDPSCIYNVFLGTPYSNIVTLTVNPLPTISSNASATTVCLGTSVTLTGSGATSYLWTGGITNGVSFTPSSTITYTVTGTDVNSCSNTATKTITVLQPISNSQSPTICAGQSKIVGIHTYTTNGTYHDTLTSFHGCDSAVTTHLTVDSVNTSVSVSNATLTASATNATYQWINCNNGNTPIAGQTNQSYTATTSGNYAVVVTHNSCSDTSTCYNITTTGIIKNSFSTTINIYPNPFNLQTTITFTQEQKNTIIKIMDVLGKEIKSINFTGKQLLIGKGELDKGIYFLQVMDENKNIFNKKIVVQ